MLTITFISYFTFLSGDKPRKSMKFNITNPRLRQQLFNRSEYCLKNKMDSRL